MDGLRPGRLGHGDDLVAAQIALLGGGGADQHCFVAHGDVLGVGVRFGIHGDGLDAHAARGSGTRQAISPRLAIRIFVNIVSLCGLWLEVFLS
jgi:hypothetical protein